MLFLTSNVSLNGGLGIYSKLMRSIFLDYYIGSLLLWKGNERRLHRPCLASRSTGTREMNTRNILFSMGSND